MKKTNEMVEMVELTDAEMAQVDGGGISEWWQENVTTPIVDFAMWVTSGVSGYGGGSRDVATSESSK